MIIDQIKRNNKRMKSIRDKYGRITKSALSTYIDQDYVIQGNLQPELSYNKFNTIFSSQLGQYQCINPRHQEQLTARQQLREYMHVRKANTIDNIQFHSREFQPIKTQVLYPKFKSPSLQKYPKPQSLQFDKENHFNSLNLASTQRTANKQNDTKQKQKMLQKQILINLELKEETQHLRTQIYQLRNVQIEFQKIKIYVRKIQNQLSDQNLIIFELRSQNQLFLKGFNQLEAQFQSKTKDSQLMEIQLIQTNQKVKQLTQQKTQRQQLYSQQKQHTDIHIKQMEKQSFDKSNQLTELYRQNQELSSLVQEKQRENSQIYAHYEDSLKVVDLMQERINHLMRQKSQTQKSWEKQVQKYDILFKQLQQVIEEKEKETQLIKMELNDTKLELQKYNISAKNESQSIVNDLNKLKQQNMMLKGEIQALKSKQQHKDQVDESVKRQYIPKKWFQQKIYYEYTLNSLQNELQALKQENGELVIPKQTQKMNKDLSQALIVNKQKPKQQNNTQTQTEEFNLGQIELEQSQKSKIIQEQQDKIFYLQKQLNQLYTEIDNQKKSYQQNNLEELNEKYQQLQKKYQEEKQKLIKQKQNTEDLTMESLLLKQQVQESRVKIRSKQHI